MEDRSKLKTCPICGMEVEILSPDDWKPTLQDPDSGGDPYAFSCGCGMTFHTDSYDFEEAARAFNRRELIYKIAKELEQKVIACEKNGAFEIAEGIRRAILHLLVRDNNMI